MSERERDFLVPCERVVISSRANGSRRLSAYIEGHFCSHFAILWIVNSSSEADEDLPVPVSALD